MKKIVFLFGLMTVLASSMKAQILTKEDSLAAGLNVSSKTTILSGYGEIMASYNEGLKTANSNVNRFVLFFGHRFNKKVTLFSELELENARVSANGGSGEFGLEQVFIKFDLNRNQYLVAGLFIPRIGIINENHLPTTFNGNNRHFLETQMIPATWRELGVGLYGRFNRLPGFNYYVGLTNGLNSSGFTRTTGIVNGRYEGSNASSSNLAVSAAALYYYKNFRFQASAYYGGSAGLNPKTADSLELNSGMFGTPVALGEVNVQYTGKRLGFKALTAAISIPEAYEINRAYANNTADLMLGALAEINYNIIDKGDLQSKKLIGFARYEWFDLNYRMPQFGIKDDALNQQYLVMGLTYKPTVGVAVKLDAVNRVSGKPNAAFNIPSLPQAPRYLTNNWFYNLGLAYNF